MGRKKSWVSDKGLIYLSNELYGAGHHMYNWEAKASIMSYERTTE